MEMLISQDWLRRKVESDPDTDSDAGPFIMVLESIGMFLPPDVMPAETQAPRVVEAFGVLVRQFRRQKQWTVEELARRARVDAEDLRQIERSRPRQASRLPWFPPGLASGNSKSLLTAYRSSAIIFFVVRRDHMTTAQSTYLGHSYRPLPGHVELPEPYVPPMSVGEKLALMTVGIAGYGCIGWIIAKGIINLLAGHPFI